jgi:hypothetical protein
MVMKGRCHRKLPSLAVPPSRGSKTPRNASEPDRTCKYSHPKAFKQRAAAT